MISRDDEFYFDFCPTEKLNQEASRISRLQLTLQNRLNLINLYEKSINKNYIPMTIKNIEIDIESEFEIVNFIDKNIKHIEKLKNWFNKNGTVWQKDRLLKKIKD